MKTILQSTNDATTKARLLERITRRRSPPRPRGFGTLAALIAAAGCALAGCAVDAGSTPAPTATGTSTEQVGTTGEALASGGGGGGASFSCGALGCICNGDWDCNNMFGSGVCGSWPAKCYTRGPSQYCICAPWVGKAGSGASGVTAGIGTVAASQAAASP